MMTKTDTSMPVVREHATKKTTDYSSDFFFFFKVFLINNFLVQEKNPKDNWKNYTPPSL